MSDPVTAAAIIGAATMGSTALAGKSQEQAAKEAKEFVPSEIQKAWAEKMGGEYPAYTPSTVSPEMVALTRRMMEAKLPEGVEQAYGAGAEREYGGMLGSLADIGAGPATLALARRGVMQGLGERIAQARMGAVEKGLSFAPSAFLMEQAPYQAAVRRWQDIVGMYPEQAKFLGPEAAGTPIAKKKTKEWKPYNPIQQPPRAGYPETWGPGYGVERY